MIIPRRQMLVMIHFLVLWGMAGAGRAEEGQDVLGDPLPNEALARMGTVRDTDQVPADFPQPFSLRGAALSADGKILATSGEPANPQAGRPIHLWDATNGKLLRELEGHDSPIRALAISPDGKTLVSSSFDVSEGTGLTRIWDVATGQSRHVIAGGGNFVRFTPEGRTFWLVVRDKILLYQAESGEEIRRFLGPNLTLDLSADGRLALGISHTRDTVMRLYDVNNNRELSKLAGSEGAVRLARFSPDGRTVAAVDQSANIRVWEVLTGQLVHQLAGHQGRVFALAFSPDGQFLVSGGLDKTLRVWELATGEEIHRHTGHEGIVTVLDFSKRTRRLVSGSTDRTALLWNTTGSLVSRLEVPELKGDALPNLWNDLAAATPSRAYRAMGTLAAAEEEMFPYLLEQLEGLLIPTKNNRIERLLKELNHDDSLIRQRATRELRKLRQIAGPLLMKVLKETESAEVRARLRYILSGSDHVSRFNEEDKLRMRRLIQLAEQVDTPPARSLLELLAAECPLEPIAQEAQRVLANRQNVPR